MEVYNSQKIKSVVFSTIEGAFYSFLLGVFIWGVLYLIYILEGYYRNSDTSAELNIHRLAFPIDILEICLKLIFLVALLKFIEIVYNGHINTSVSNWVKTGIFTFIGLYLIVFIREIYIFWVFDSNCCYDSVAFALWISIFILILIFSIFYAIIRNYFTNFGK